MAERSEALVARWTAEVGDGGTLEVDINDATQAVTMEVMYEAGDGGSVRAPGCYDTTCLTLHEKLKRSPPHPPPPLFAHNFDSPSHNVQTN